MVPGLLYAQLHGCCWKQDCRCGDVCSCSPSRNNLMPPDLFIDAVFSAPRRSDVPENVSYVEYQHVPRAKDAVARHARPHARPRACRCSCVNESEEVEPPQMRTGPEGPVFLTDSDDRSALQTDYAYISSLQVSRSSCNSFSDSFILPLMKSLTGRSLMMVHSPFLQVTG